MIKAIKKILKHNYYQQVGSQDHINASTTQEVLREIVQRRKTDTLLNTVLNLDIGFTTGSGYFLESKSEALKSRVQKWINETSFDDIIHQLSEDLLSSGNAYIRIYQGDLNPIVQVLPLDSVTPIDHDMNGNISKYLVTINSQTFEIPADQLTHATWRKQTDGYGLGIANTAASRGAGYYSNSGQRVRKQNYFETREGILDLSLKAFASSLPRYLATTSNANEQSVNTLSENLARIEPLSSLAVSDDVSITEMSLNSKTKIDALIQILNQEDVSALSSPIQQLWSLRGHSWAAARESVRVMMPFLHSFEIAVTKIINEIFATLFGAGIEIKFGSSERITIEQIKTVTDIINSDEEIKSRIDPDKVMRLFQQAGLDLEKAG